MVQISNMGSTEFTIIDQNLNDSAGIKHRFVTFSDDIDLDSLECDLETKAVPFVR